MHQDFQTKVCIYSEFYYNELAEYAESAFVILIKLI